MIRHEWIGETDLERALDLAPPNIRPLLLLAGWAGLRCKEIAQLRATDAVWTAEPTIVVRVGTERIDRLVPMPPWLVDQLQACELPNTGYLFAKGDGHIPANSVSRLGGDYLRSLGIDYTMRHLRNRFIFQQWVATKWSQYPTAIGL